MFTEFTLQVNLSMRLSPYSSNNISDKRIELIKTVTESIEFFKANFISILVLTLIIEFPFIIISHTERLGSLLPGGFRWAWFADIGYLLLGVPIAMGAQSKLYFQIIHGSEFNFKECLETVRYYFNPLVIASMFYIGLFLVGLLLFVIPGLIISSRLSLFPFYIIYEKLNPIAALTKSFVITRNYLWEVVVPVSFFNFIFLTVQYAVPSLFPGTGIGSYLIVIIIDLLIAFLGWIGLVIPFRVYCMNRNNEG